MSTNSLFVNHYQCFGKQRGIMTLAENLIRFRKAKRLSQKKLAELVGVQQNTIAAIEVGKTHKTKFLPELAKVLGVSVTDLDPNLGVNENVIIPAARLVGESDLPVFASVEAGDGSVLVSSEPVQTVRRPDPLATVRGGYGVIVVGDSMSPLIRPGDTVLVHPHLPPKSEDFCLFMCPEDAPGSDFRATIKEYVSQTAELWKVRRYGENPKDFGLKKAEWPRCHVVVGIYRRR